MLTVADLSRLLQISLGSAYRLSHRLPFMVKVGGAIRIPEDELMDWIEKGGERCGKGATYGGRQSTLKGKNPGDSVPARETGKPQNVLTGNFNSDTRFRLKSRRYLS